MRRIWLGTFVALISVLAMVGMSHAALLTLQSGHDITVTLTKEGGGQIAPSPYIISAIPLIYVGIGGYAEYPSQAPNNVLQQQTTGLPGTVTAALPGGTWLTQTDATTTRNTATTFTIAQNFLGSAPSPSTPGGIDGYLTQTGIKTVPGNNVVSNYFRIWYRNVAAGDYTADLSDLYTFTYSLVQGAGSSNRYYSTDGSLLLNLRMYAGTGRDGEVHESFVSDTRSDPNFYPLSDFALSGADTANLSVHLSNVPATTNIFIEGWLAAQQSGSSVVPLPGALVLLGAGLVRLVAYSRRKRALA